MKWGIGDLWFVCMDGLDEGKGGMGGGIGDMGV